MLRDEFYDPEKTTFAEPLKLSKIKLLYTRLKISFVNLCTPPGERFSEIE